MRTILFAVSMSAIPCLTLVAQVAVAGVLPRSAPEAKPGAAGTQKEEVKRRTVSITADGTIKNIVKSGEEKSPAAGSVGFVLTGLNHRISGFTTVASSIDTLKGTDQKRSAERC